MSYVFEIKERIPSKKNSYQIRFSRSFLSAMQQIPAFLKGKRRYWIGPSKAVKDAELMIAWRAKAAIAHRITTPCRVIVEMNGKMDTDNALGVILDGLEKSGKLENDRLVEEIRIRRTWGGKGARVTIETIEEAA